MGQCKEQVIEATGGLFANPIEKKIRLRIYQLKQISSERGLSPAEASELGTLIDRLPDDEEDYSHLDKD